MTSTSTMEGGRLYYPINVYVKTVILSLLFCNTKCLNWLQVKIVWLDIDYECFKHSCTDTKLRFVVKETILEHSFCWPINVAGIVQPVDSYFVPNDSWLNFSVEIAGKDPMYNFPRVCDRSEIEDLPIPTLYSAVFPKGRCFNATVTVQPAKFVSYDSTVSKLMANTNGTHGNNGDYPLISSYFLAGLTPVPVWVVFILAALNILLLISIVVLLFISRRKRRKDALREFELAVSRTASEETRYELPWEQKYRPLPSYLKELQQQGTMPRGPSLIREECVAMPVINANV